MAYVVIGYWELGYVISDDDVDLSSALQEVAPGALIELFQLELNAAQHGVNATYYFHAGLTTQLTEIEWGGQAYQPLPIQAEGFEWSGQGSLPRPKLTVSNIFGTITTLILTLPDGLEGAKVTRIRTLGRYLEQAPTDQLLLEDGSTMLLESSDFLMLETGAVAATTAEFPREIYYVDRKAAETRDVIEFELASAFDLAGVRAPKRQCLTRCQWKYRSPECGYIGSSYFDAKDNPVVNYSHDVCGKRINSCELRFGASSELPFGGYPGIGTYSV